MIKLLFVILITLYILDVLVLMRHCQMGFMSFKDVWDSPKIEKIYYLMASATGIVFLVLMIAMIVKG